ncbi:choice-of-anchor Q domain-containing protein [Winogradskyella sp.]|uniref:choice-of-anchor Q domain-containing protein n=1 Tax=Winogradskyella sp. TaxID=1883156 RepID=UPI003BAAFF27
MKLAGAIIIFSAFQLQAQTFTVTKADDTDDGVCDAADCSLREALKAAYQANGDNIINFASPYFDTPRTITLTLGQLEIGPPSGGHGGDYIINGPGQDLLTIDGNLQHRVFYAGFGHIDVEINNLTIANGKPDQPGTANDSQPYPQWGGGIMKLGGDPGSYCRLINVTIENCEALRGGAVSSYGGNMYLDGVTLRNNTSTGYGSAIEEEGRIFEIKNSAIYGNSGSAPIRMHASIANVDFKMENTTISGNSTPAGGSAIEFITTGGYSQTLNMNSNTITNNTSGSDGEAGAAITFSANNLIDGTIDNSILSGNLANGSPSDIGNDSFTPDSGNNLIGAGATQINATSNIFNVNDPLLAPLADNGGNTLSHLPYGNSPALNAGFTSLTTDQVGNARGIFGTDDIGAIELPSVGSYVVTKTEDTNDGVCDGDCSLREAFIAANNDPGTDVIEFSSLFNSPQTITVRAPEYQDPNNTSSPILFGQMEVGAAGGFGGSLIIKGPGQDLLTIDGNNATRVFYNGFAHLNLTISDLTIVNGNSATIQGPYNTYGGGILLLGTNTTTLTNVTIGSCTSDNGGAISSWTGTINLNGVTLSENSASYGAAIESEAGTLNINNSAIINNSGAEALKVWASNSSSGQAFIVNNSTISGNTAPIGGSAIETRTNSGRKTTMLITNSTITNNVTEAAGSSAAISHQGTLNATTWTVHNSIISGNTAEGAPADVVFHDFEAGSSYNIIGTGTAITDGTNNNIIGVDDPLLLPLADNGGNTLSHSFFNTSPAYNNGIALDSYKVMDFSGATTITSIEDTLFGNDPNYCDLYVFVAPATARYEFTFSGTTEYLGNDADPDNPREGISIYLWDDNLVANSGFFSDRPEYLGHTNRNNDGSYYDDGGGSQFFDLVAGETYLFYVSTYFNNSLVTYDGELRVVDSGIALNDQVGNLRNYNDQGYDIGAIELQSDSNVPPIFRARVFLQGAAIDPVQADGEENLMRDDLRVAGMIPTTSPYSDGLTCDSSVFGDIDDESIVDWVFVELRDKDNSAQVVYSRSALLNRDGFIVDVDGQANLRPTALAGDYYVAIKHRNHIGVITAAPVTLSGTTTLIDFTDPINVEGGTNSVVLLPNTLHGMYTGDYDGNAQIQNTDASAVIQLIGSSGYNEADMDINTQVQNTDVNALINPNIGRGQQFNRPSIASDSQSSNVTLAFANAQITNDGTDDFYEADIMISSTSDFYVGSGQVYLDYNTAAFGDNVSTNSTLEYSQPDGSILGHSWPGVPFPTPAYKDFVHNDNTTSRVSLSFQQNIALVGLETATELVVTTTPKVLFHIKIRYADVNEDANICFYSDGVFQDQFFTACGGTTTADCTNTPGVQIMDDTYDCSQSAPSTLTIAEVENDTLLLYPNPVKTSFYIKGLKTIGAVRVYDINGRLILQMDNVEGEQAIDMSAHEDGIYLVEVTTENLSVTKRLIKKSN